jgi:hypothetical protein
LIDISLQPIFVPFGCTFKPKRWWYDNQNDDEDDDDDDDDDDEMKPSIEISAS